MIVPFPVLLRPGAEGVSPEVDRAEAMPSASERTDAGSASLTEGRTVMGASSTKATAVSDADILLGLVGRPLPWWRFLGW